MKNKFLNILIIFITFTIIIQITAVVSATDLSATEKKNIEDFLKKEENLMFSSTYYSSVYELPILDSFNIAWLIATNKGTLVDGNTQLSESEFNEVDKITNGFKAYSFTQKDADEFLKSKIGINFNELKEYKEYESKHTISTSKEIYYEVVEGGGPEIYEIDKIESIKKMENGNIKVKVSYNNGLNNIVTLKPSGDSYLFVSCINNNPDYKVENRVTSNKEDDTIAKKSIPQTGIRENIIIFSTIMIIGIMVIVILIKNNKLKDI